jgi:serine/threonine-protein kinase
MGGLPGQGPETRGWWLGVDFGTSNTAAAHINANTGAVTPLALAHSGNLMSSSVFVASPSQIEVGDVALNKATGDPTGFIAAPKRVLTAAQDTFVVRDWEIPAHTVVAAVLRAVLIRAQSQHEGRPPAGLVLTHPEEWSARQIRVLTDAANEIGYPAHLVRTISEPQAAAHYYTQSVPLPPDARIAVFDFGGGTLDIAVLQADPDGSFRVTAARGDNALGGRNFDSVVRRWVDGQLAQRNPALAERLRADASSMDVRALEESVRHAKELLSETPSAMIEVRARGLEERLSLTRHEFDELIGPEVDRAMTLTRITLELGGIRDTSDIQTIYLTGGSSRIPLVHRRLQQFGRVATLDDPKTVVARGALMAVARTPIAAGRPVVAAPGEPRRFGHYQLRTLLGRGSMGQVYEAYDTGKDRVVALKILDVDLGKDPGYRERFRRESQAAARLAEPHVIPIHDWGEIDGMLFIDMRLVRGHNLGALLRRSGPLPPARATAVVEQIAAALDAAHRIGLIHRDVKPENILIAEGDFAYLADFGIAQSSTDIKLTATGNPVGSYAYMAPERFDDGPASAAVDIYALACVLYEALTGLTPFPAASISKAIKSHLADEPPRPSAHPGVPPAFDAVVARGMAKHPAQRYRSAGELAHAAREALTGRLLPGAGPPPTAMTMPRSAPEFPAVAPAPKPRGRMTPVLIGAGVVIVAVAAVLGTLLSTRHSDAASSTTSVPSSSVPSNSEPIAQSTTIAPIPFVTEPSQRPTLATPVPAPLVGSVSGTDGQGFLGTTARCRAADPAMVIARTTGSDVVVCEAGVGLYYYQGLRRSDNAPITLNDPVPAGNGFQVTNPTDGTVYQINSSALTITRDGNVLGQESTVEYAHR